jgi:transposase InsO family protein
MAAVCTSTFGGANSGKTSTGIARSRPPPKTIIATARPTTRYLNLRLDPTIQRIMGVDLLVNAAGTGFPERCAVRPLTPRPGASHHG